ncbi:MAG: S-methyl-5'-thioadenosine phosphorylase [Candidatus Bathyarchaeota archaeon BA1]|nr:MAG: S-methyl-5'-thioadenosine phosphorylase [Candidatus Bathyarchaeota archaeon BA1]
MRSLKRVDIAIIGGTGLEALLKGVEQIQIGTPYGLPPPISIGEAGGKLVAFLPRHGIHHSVPPHKVNYRANVYALHEIGVERIIATNAVGAINLDLEPGDLVIPHDLIDFTKLRQLTFYDEAPVTHIDVSQPYCPEIRTILIETTNKYVARMRDRSVLVCMEGPRYETPAEIEMLRRMGCDVVGMTGVPEATLARELEMCYATICFISNMAAGIQQRLTASEVAKVAKEKMPIIQKILTETIERLPKDRRCPCAHALKDARF